LGEFVIPLNLGPVTAAAVLELAESHERSEPLWTPLVVSC
jgi:hypothetical protein